MSCLIILRMAVLSPSPPMAFLVRPQLRGFSRCSHPFQSRNLRIVTNGKGAVVEEPNVTVLEGAQVRRYIFPQSNASFPNDCGPFQLLEGARRRRALMTALSLMNQIGHGTTLRAGCIIGKDAVIGKNYNTARQQPSTSSKQLL